MKPADQIRDFAHAARVFEKWVLNGTESGAVAGRHLLVLVLDLYARGLELPSLTREEDKSTVRVTDDEWKHAHNMGTRLPFDYYGEIFDPLAVPPGEPGLASLSDDVADVYRDLANGLRLYDNGHLNAAVWQWRSSFECHWGRHASSAIRALHYWLAAKNEFGNP